MSKRVKYIKACDVKKAVLNGFIDKDKYTSFVKWIADEVDRIVKGMPAENVEPINICRDCKHLTGMKKGRTRLCNKSHMFVPITAKGCFHFDNKFDSKEV